MREIKFRGKRVDNGEWLYGDLIRNSIINPFTYIQIGVGYGVDNLDIGNPIKVLPESVGQCLDLKDYKGNEIYEGDICKDICDEKLYKILYCDEWVGFYFFDLETKSYKHPCDVYPQATIEVIGNVFENAELLR